MTRLLAWKLLFACWDISGVYSTYLCHTRQPSRISGTVPISTTVSRCPAEHSICPEFIRRRSVRFLSRATDRAYETTAHARTFLLPCLHEQCRFTIFYNGYAGREVHDSPPRYMNTHGKNVQRGFLRARAIFVPILVKQNVPLCDRLIGTLHILVLRLRLELQHDRKKHAHEILVPHCLLHFLHPTHVKLGVVVHSQSQTPVKLLALLLELGEVFLPTCKICWQLHYRTLKVTYIMHYFSRVSDEICSSCL